MSTQIIPDDELHGCTQEAEPLFECPDCPDVENCIHLAQGYDTLTCNHIFTGHQHDEPMTQNADSRDSADLPSIQ